jgi:hypothetical protein
MIVQCISFGSHWWLKEVCDQRTGEFLRYRSAFINTTRVNCAKTEKFKHWLPGFVRINAGTWPRFDALEELLQVKFHTDGVVRYKDSNRLLLRSRAAEDAQVDQYLVCISSRIEGTINFNSDWRCGAPARIFSSSYFKKMQETLLLLRQETIVKTSIGSWRIICKDKTSFLGLVDDQ